MKKVIRIFCATLLLGFVFSATPLFAGGHHHHDDDRSDKKAPIDGGLTILLAAGLGLGAKKIIDLKKSKTQPIA